MTDRRGRLIEGLLQASPDALLVVDQHGVVELATQAVGGLFGYEPDEIVGRSIDVLLPADMKGRHHVHREAYWEAPSIRPMGAGLNLRAVRRDGSEVPVDVSLVPMDIDGRMVVGAFVRDATLRRRDDNLLRFVNEISRSTIEGWETDELLKIVSKRSRELIGATVAWVAVADASSDSILVAAADGPATQKLSGATVPTAVSLAAQVMRRGRPLIIADMTDEALVLSEARALGLGPGMYLPMMAENGPVGALVLARSSHDSPFDADEVTAAEVFASAAGIVLALGNARRSIEHARLAGEHERIARDLHDTVIQRLFALGMRLQATERLAAGPVAERIHDTVDAIDEVIREIRETIFDLNRPDAGEARLRQQVRAVIQESVSHLGFEPRVAFRGAVEVAIGDDAVGHLLPVLREALANVGRHAQASRVDVVVSALGGSVTLTVADDGIGVPDTPSAGQGMSNMLSRAESLGGKMELTRRRPSGTLLSWSVPRTN